LGPISGFVASKIVNKTGEVIIVLLIYHTVVRRRVWPPPKTAAVLRTG
jgi:hypothetical protein